jgi:hypothetical protein
MRKDYQYKQKKTPKAIWNYIESKTKVKEGIGELHIDPNNIKSAKTDDDKEKADILGNYFSTVFTKEPDGPAPHLENKELFSLLIILLCGTVSKAFWKSIFAYTIYFSPESTAWANLTDTSNSCNIVDLPVIKPNCFFENRLFCLM